MVEDVGEKLNSTISEIASLNKNVRELRAAGIGDCQSRPKYTPENYFVSKVKEETQHAKCIFHDRPLSCVLCFIFP